MRRPVSSNPLADAVVDSVIVHYFLLTDHGDLLCDLLGSPLRVPRTVYDPDETPGTPPAAMSEMRRAIEYHDRHAAQRSRPPAERTQFAALGTKLREVDRIHAAGQLQIVDMTAAERSLFGQLTSPEHSGRFGLAFPLGAGEAACVAIAHTRGWVLATDDADALRALEAVSPGHPYERIRKLLIRAATADLITREDANQIHSAMTGLGFWDKKQPFTQR